MEFHRQLLQQHHLQCHLHCGNDPTVANHNGIPSATHPPAPLAIPSTLRERSYSCKSQWNSVDRTCTKNRLKPHLQCGTDPSMIRPWSETDPTMIRPHTRPSRNRPHRRGRSSRFGDGLCMEKHRVSCICYLSKTHFVRDFLQNSIGNSSTSTTCNPIYSEGAILELQITMEFHRQLIHQHHLQSHLHCGNDPTVANHNGIPSATHPPAPLAIPSTLRERSYSCKSQWNSVDHRCTKHRWHPIYNAEPIRAWSETDPTMIRPHTRPSRNRRTAEVDHRGSGTDFVWKNIGFRASAISQKTHFVRDFLQNSIGNSSTSTTCNPIYSEGTILELQITMEFHRQLIHQHHLQSHYTLRERSYSCKSQWNSVDHKCTKHRWHPIYNAEPIRAWSETDPTMIRPHTRTVSQPAAPQR